MSLTTASRRALAVFGIAAIAALSALAGIVATLAVTDPLGAHPAPAASSTSPVVDGPYDGRADAEPMISVAQARAIALREAGDGETTEAELEWEHGVLVWSIDVMKAAVEYDVDIDAMTGAVLWYGLDN